MTLRLSWDLAGTGEPLLLLHGTDSTHDDFSALRPQPGAAIVIATPQRARAEVPPAPRQCSEDDAAGVTRLPTQARMVTILNVS
jgi:hypothetical protein